MQRCGDRFCPPLILMCLVPVSHLFLVINSSVNIIIYCIAGDGFRYVEIVFINIISVSKVDSCSLHLFRIFNISAWASSHSLKIFLVKVLVTCFQNFVAVGNIFSNTVHQLLSTFLFIFHFRGLFKVGGHWKEPRCHKHDISNQ